MDNPYITFIIQDIECRILDEECDKMDKENNTPRENNDKEKAKRRVATRDLLANDGDVEKNPGMKIDEIKSIIR